MRPCSIIGIVEQSFKSFYDQAASKDINLLIDMDDKLPKIYADPEKISWVINNLVSNALKYTNAGDEISVSAEIKNNKMQISVKDTGAGIPQEYLKKIFDQFVQVKGYDLEVRGTGLGLTLAKEIVVAHGGEIWCESQIDVGSTFTFTLPLQNKE
jgi:signal transduction histidine kinase